MLLAELLRNLSTYLRLSLQALEPLRIGRPEAIYNRLARERTSIRLYHRP